MLRELSALEKSGKLPNERMAAMFSHYGMDWQLGVKWIKETKGDLYAKHAFMDQYKTGALRFNEEVVLTPNPARLPMWHSNPDFAIFRHLKTFPVLMGNTVLKQWWIDTLSSDFNQPGTLGSNFARNSTAIFSAIMIADFANQLRDKIKYKEGKNPIYEKFFGQVGVEAAAVRRTVRALETAGFLSVGSFAADAFLTSGFGGGMLSIFGPEVTKTWALSNAFLSGNARAAARELTRLSVGTGYLQQAHGAITDEVASWLEKLGFDPGETPGALPPLKKMN
jgi:hypothetical protein